MDDILSDLQSFKPGAPPGGGRGGRGRAWDYRHSDQYIGSAFDGEDYDGSHYGSGSRAPLAGKMGSFVERGLEHMTTNLFVGNLDPSTVSEDLRGGGKHLFVTRSLTKCDVFLVGMMR